LTTVFVAVITNWFANRVKEMEFILSWCQY